MQIINNGLIKQIQTTEDKLKPTVGDIISITIKERINNGEAVANLRGVEATVRFEGSVPSSDKVLVEITQQPKEGPVYVKQVATGVVSNSAGDTVSKPNIDSLNNELKQGVAPFVSRDIPLSKEAINTIQNYIKTGSGSVEQKIETLKIIAQKNIEVTSTNIKAVHEALNGEPLSSSLKKIAKGLDVTVESLNKESSTAKNTINTMKVVEDFRVLKEKAVQEPNLSKAIIQVKEATKIPDLPQRAVEKIERAIREAVQLQQVGRTPQARTKLTEALTQVEQDLQAEEPLPAARPSEAIRAVKEKVSQEPILSKAIDQVKETVNTQNLPQKTVEKVERAIREAVQLQQVGRTAQARTQLTEALTQVEQDVQGEEPLPAARPSEAIRAVKEKVSQEPILSKAIDQVKETVKALDLPQKAVEKVEQAIREAVQLQQVGRTAQARTQLTEVLTQVEQDVQAEEPLPAARPSEDIRSVKEKVSQEPILSKAIDQVKEMVNTQNLPQKAVEKVERANRETVQLQQVGRTAQARTQLTEALTQVEQDLQSEELPTARPSEAIRAAKEKVSQEPILSKAIDQVNELLKSSDLTPKAVEKVERANREAVQLQQISQTAQARTHLTDVLNQVEPGNQAEDSRFASIKPMQTEGQSTQASENMGLHKQNDESGFSHLVKDLLKDVQKEPSFNKVLEKMNELISKNPLNQHIDELKNAHDKAGQLNQQGRELAARREVSNAISKIDDVTPNQQSNTAETKVSELEQYLINEALQGLNLNSKDVIVTEITKKLSQMAIDFKKIKQDITKNLDNVSRMIENQKNIPPANIKQVLDSTIHKLQTAILKSDFLLYTDMVTEKKLLTASSQLTEARKLLEKGNVTEANQLVKDVKANLEKIIFKPSDVKVKHFISDQSFLEPFSPKQISNLLDQTVRPFPDQEPSARHMYEMVRKLGLTHENDSAHAFISKQGNFDDFQEQENLKSVLLKMMKNEELKPAVHQQVEQAVNNITGQQLLNKQDPAGMQNLFFQLPYLIDKQIENVKIFVNSRKEGEKVDWENCSLYFVLETKKMGDIGVLLNSTDRNLSITFKSNKTELDKKVDSFTEITKERFQEIGYHLTSLGVKKLAGEKESNLNDKTESNGGSRLTPAFSEKGYDFTI
ncbi:hypothetical protein D0469_09670 [Peribacillus saganii]|uniref:Flagellar hook-length control protein-like C-terminal domain-containing protein n=1 Tax=Peribacillus saganii TaxID=2303992 RepID=A0A372LP61_9BACI|nr:hypothetical protein [Peribacillus saganii]RFU69337.1 hypothetical protein D0469_09670 [Peribacillus saganii]